MGSFWGIPGKNEEEGTSLYAMGKDTGSFPDGVTLPLNISTMALPPCWPACQANRIASG